MPLGEEFSNSLLVTVAGGPLPADVLPLLVSGYVDDSSNLPGLFVLRFTDEHGTVLTKGGFAIGTAVELSLQSSDPGGPQGLLAGEVTSVEVDLAHDGTHTTVRGLDLAHRLFRGTRVEAYLNMTASDIVAKVAGRVGLQVEADPTTVTHDHVMQDGISDWDFLRRLADENGFLLGIAEGRLTFRARPQATAAPSGSGGARRQPLVLERGVNLVSLRGTVTAHGQVPEVEVRGWDPATKQAVVSRKPAGTTSAELDTTHPRRLAGDVQSPPYVVGLPTVAVQTSCDLAAQSLADHLAGGFAELEGVARGNPALRSGAAITLVGVGEPFAGRYTLTSTRHTFSAEHGYLTSFSVSNTSERSLYGTVSGGRATRPRNPGVVPAIVTNIKDSDQGGRVKVRFPFLSDGYESGWARPVLPGAGDRRGLVSLPEVGDEVLVAFGDEGFGHPYVLGGLYNGQDQPDKAWPDHVDTTSGEVTRRALVSRTGMCVEMLESPQGESLIVSTNDGAQHLTLVQKPDKVIRLASEGPIEVIAKQDVTLTTDTGNVTVKGMDVTVEAANALTLKGTTVAVEASASLDLEGATVKASGSATAELSAGATTTVRGALVKIN